MSVMTLKEADATIRKRLAGGPPTGPLLREIICELGSPPRISALIADLLNDPEALATGASMSTAHSNGFDVLYLLCPNDGSYRLRLHVWWPNKYATHTKHIHDHPWNFASKLLSGEYELSTFALSKTGTEVFEYSCSPLFDVQGYRICFVGIERVIRAFSTRFRSGSIYAQDCQCLHAVERTSDTVTSSLFLHGAFVRESTRLLTHDKNLSEGTSLLRPFGRELFEAKLRTYLEILSR